MQKEYLSFLSILPLSNGGSHFKIIFFRSFFWEMGGMGKARNGLGGKEGGSWFYHGGDGKFLKSLQIVGRRVLTTLFYEDPLYCLPSFFRFCPTPSLSSPISTPTVLSVMDNMDLHILSLGTLVPQGSWCVFYAIRNQVYWALTHNVVFLWCSDLISYTHTAHSGASRLTHLYNYILTPPVMCSQQLPLLH